MKDHLQELLRQALASLAGDALAGVELPAAVALERSRDSGHGDWATNVALTLARPARRKPRELAELIVAALPASPQLAKVEIAGPGFINFFLAAGTTQAVVAQVLAQGAAFGRSTAGAGERVLVEFVSANPTGPMHVGHGRNAAYGDSLARLLDAAGYAVEREYYINDAGRQVDVLTTSLWLRYLAACGAAAPPFPRRGYPGAYVEHMAAALRTEAGESLLRDGAADPGLPADGAEGDKDTQEAYLDALIARCRQLLGADYARVRDFGLAAQLADIRATLDAFGVAFDRWASERALVDSGAAAHAIERLRAAGHVYEKDGAVWLRTSEFGDEKDRVLFKADGAATYFANDLAYHVDKLERGFVRLVDVWGADHHGYIARVRAAIGALTGRPDALSVQLIQFVTLSSGRMGKRSGNFVTLQDLIGEAGRDATRFFYLLRSHDQHLEFDIELARSQSNDNPVYYVQYAHARICSVLRQMTEKGFSFDQAAGLAALALLTEPHEQALLTRLARYPELVLQAARQQAPHSVAHYLRDLADGFHSYYNAHTFLVEEPSLRNARLALILATRQVLQNGLALLGVSAPETM